MDLEKELQTLKELTQEIEEGNNSKENLERLKNLRKNVIKSGKQELKLMIEETKRVKDEQKGQIQEKIRILEQTDPLTNQVKDKIDKLNDKLKQVDNLDDVLKKHVLEMAKEFKKYGITPEELGLKKTKQNKKDIKTVEKLNPYVEEPEEVKEDDERLEELKSIEEYGIGKTIEQIEKIEKEIEELGNKGEKVEPISVEELERSIQQNREYYNKLYKEKKKVNIISKLWNRIKKALGLKKENKTLTSGMVETDESSWKDSIEVDVKQLSAQELEKNARKQLENQVGIGSIAKIEEAIDYYDIEKKEPIGKIDIMKDKEFKIDFIALLDKEGNMEHCLNSGNIGKILAQRENLESVIKVHLLPVEDEEEKDDIEYEETEQDDDEGIWVLWNDVKGKFVDYMLKQKEAELGNI